MSSELVVLSAADTSALVAGMVRLTGYIDRVPDAELADIAFTCAQERGPSRIAFVVDSVSELRSRLVSASSRLAGGTMRRLRDKSGTYWYSEPLLGEGRGKLAFVYPGVASFYPDMLRDLAIELPQCREAFGELEEAMAGKEDFSPFNFIFPPADCYRHDADIFSSGAYAEALVSTYAACDGLTRVLRDVGLVPDAVVGFAGGDLAAMMRSGAAGAAPTRSERVEVIRDIYRIVDKAVSHGGLVETAMVAVVLKHEEDGGGALAEILARFPKDTAVLALDLSPRQKTYAVALDRVDELMHAFVAAGIRAMKLPLNRPFNTPMSESLVPAVMKFTTGWMKKEPLVYVYSCATAEPVPRKVRHARRDTAERWAKPVRFTETVRRMYADGCRVFLEVGPRGLMTSCVEDTLKGEEHAAIAVNSIHRRGMLQLLHAVAQLVALGADMDVAAGLRLRGAKTLDFDSALGAPRRRESEKRLSRVFPRLGFISDEPLQRVGIAVEPQGRGAKVAARREAQRKQDRRRQRQFDFGTVNPLVSDADLISQNPNIDIELRKTFKLSEAPFIADFAIGTSQLSYSDPNLRGLVLLTLPVAAEIMGETASMLVPDSVVTRIENLISRKSVAFVRNELTLYIKAERVASGDPNCSAVNVLIREDAQGSEYTWPVMEAVFFLSRKYPEPVPLDATPLSRPRLVHWSGREIYPGRVCAGKRLRGISFAEAWSEGGVDYEVEVPPLADNVTLTRFPVWAVNPLLMGTITSGFSLWRSHERFTGAYSFPNRCRRIDILAPCPQEGSRLRCYMRLMSAAETSYTCDLSVTDGDGVTLLRFDGWEEYTERVNPEYRELIMQPAIAYVTRPLSKEVTGGPPDVTGAFVTDVPYRVFERDSELWLRTFSHIVLSGAERSEYLSKPGNTARRTEWLFGRIAAKEAVRRYLQEKYQSRWSEADVIIYADDFGKPHAIGAWNDLLGVRLDIAIAHTARFIIAVCAANMRVGVDVETSNRDLSREFTDGVFSPEEQELAANSANAGQAIIRFWCAKEAVSKALGTGIRYSPKEMKIVSYEADTGLVAVRLTGGWEEAFRNFKGRDILVTVRNQNEHALAFCFIPEAMFA